MSIHDQRARRLKQVKRQNRVENGVVGTAVALMIGLWLIYAGLILTGLFFLVKFLASLT